MIKIMKSIANPVPGSAPVRGWGKSAKLALLIIAALPISMAVPLVLPYLPHVALERPHPADVLPPEVLLVSKQASDQAAVILASQPRGYKARQAESADAALESLQHDPNRISIVVIDNNMKGAQRVISAVTRSSSTPHLVILTGARDQGTISGMLVKAGMN